MMKMALKRNNVGNDKDEWETPRWLFDFLDDEYNFQVDVAATQQNALCPGYYTKEDDALSLDTWIDDDFDEHDQIIGEGIYRFFMNPPYSGGKIGLFMKKAYEEYEKGAFVASLIPVNSDTGYWHKYVMKATEIRFIEGRVKYIGYDKSGNKIKNSPTFPSCVVIFDPDITQMTRPYLGETITQPWKEKA
jgi:phage N-6-adenine-methyltransferase